MTTTSKKLIPNKRFPEFENSGEWVEKKIKDILNYEQPTNYIVKSDNYITHGIPVLTANKSFILGYTNETTGIYDNIPVIIFDDFTTDKKYITFPFKVKSSAIKILSTKKDYNIKFIYELMTLIPFNPQEHKRYYIGIYQNIDVLLPSLEEQQKIADFLSSVDELIELEKIKLEKLKEYKKGLLQNLFPKENQKVPDLRFPEFKNSGEWEEKKLGDIVEIIQGVAFPVKYQGKKQGDYPFCKVSDISKANEVNGGYLQIALNYIDVLEVKVLKSKILPKGTTIFAKIGEAIRLNRRAYLGVQALIDNNIAGIKFHNKEYYDLYLFHYTHIIDFNNYISGVIPSLNKSILQQIIIKLPSYKEQQKIADFLSSVDELIIEQTTKLKLLCDYKKGLLQQLFPN